MAHSGINVLLEGHNFVRLLGGLWTTVWIAALSLLIGLAFGAVLGILRTFKNRLLRLILRLYLEFFRIVPTVVLLFLAYYILPRMMHVANLPGSLMAVVAFALWGGRGIQRYRPRSFDLGSKASAGIGHGVGLESAAAVLLRLIAPSVSIGAAGNDQSGDAGD